MIKKSHETDILETCTSTSECAVTRDGHWKDIIVTMIKEEPRDGHIGKMY